MSVARTLRTASRIPPGQLLARARTMLRRRSYARRPAAPIEAARAAAAGCVPAAPLPLLPRAVVAPEGDAAVAARAAALAKGSFRFLNREADFRAGIDWDAPGCSHLWRYQLQYLGAVLDLALDGRGDAARDVAQSWLARHGSSWHPDAWHAYPASLRLVNLCNAAAALGGFDRLGPGIAESVAVHAAYLAEHLETDVRGNHILENLRALLFASRFLAGPLAARCADIAWPLLRTELAEQVLADGGHFELSPMYHSIVLHRVLELAALTGDPGLDATAARMRSYLGRVLCPDGEILLFGDSARGFAPPAAALLGGASRPTADGVLLEPESGIAVIRGGPWWTAFDVGRVCPDALPAHGQADSLTVEVWCDGRRIVGDPGLCEYTGPERAWGRSSRAHSTVTIDDRDTSEVYGSFRVGGRARVDRVMVRRERDEVTAALVPWDADARITRVVGLAADRTELRISDDATADPRGTVRSRLHLAPGVTAGAPTDDGRAVVVGDGHVRVRITAQHPVRTEPGRSSPEFGVVVPTTILVQDLAREAPGRRDAHGGWRLERLA